MIKINTEILKGLKPCANRYKNWLAHYKDFDGDIIEFLNLDKITAIDKLWVSVRVLPRDILEIFYVDCAVAAASAYAAYAAASAYASADAVYAAFDDAAAAAAYAAASADASAAAQALENENQVDALIMLIGGEL